jgi:NAD(P)-dependent dehydrogenase (short-subunit alcohol dehydrogenase family)
MITDRHYKDSPITVLHANAQLGGSTTASKSTGWDNILNANIHGVINTVQRFLAVMRDTRSFIVITGSKAAFDASPKWGAAYSVSQAAIRVFAEQLANDLKQDKACKASAHLLVPGVVQHLGTAIDNELWQPLGQQTASLTAEYALDKLETGCFYIVCPDPGPGLRIGQEQDKTSAKLDKPGMKVSRATAYSSDQSGRRLIQQNLHRLTVDLRGCLLQSSSPVKMGRRVQAELR